MFGRVFGSGSVTTTAAGHTRVWDQAFRTSHSIVGQLGPHQIIASRPAIESRRHQSSAVCITSTVLNDRQLDMPRQLFLRITGSSGAAARVGFWYKSHTWGRAELNTIRVPSGDQIGSPSWAGSNVN